MHYITTATLGKLFANTNPENGIEIRHAIKNGHFSAHLDPLLRGIQVDCLGSSPLLPWSVFEAVVELMCAEPNHEVRSGSAIAGRVGSPQCPLDSIEGHIAVSVYNKDVGTHAFSRVAPVRALLQHVGIADNRRGWVSLNPYWAANIVTIP